MPRPRKNILSVTKVLDRGSWCLVWGRHPDRVKFSVRHLIADAPAPAEAELAAERLRLELAACRARGDWPAWARGIPSVQRARDAEIDSRLNGSPSRRSSGDANGSLSDQLSGQPSGQPSSQPSGQPSSQSHGSPPCQARGHLHRPSDAAVKSAGRLYARYADHLHGTGDSGHIGSQLAFLREFVDTQRIALAEATPVHVHAFLNHILRKPGVRQMLCHQTALRRWRQNTLRKGLDPDTGEPLAEGVHRPSGPASRRAPAERPPPPPPRTIATRNHGLRALKRFYQWAVREGDMPVDPTIGLKKMTEPPPEEVAVLTHAEREAFLAAADTESDGIAIFIALCAGLRLAEIMRADWKHIHLDTRVFRVPRSKRGGEQTPRIRRVPISARLMAALEAVPAGQRTGLVAPWPMARANRCKAAGLMMKRMAAKMPGIAPGKFMWNVMRHTFCTGHLDAGVAPGVVCQWSGHTERVFWLYYAGYIREYDERIDQVDRQGAKGENGTP